MGSSLQAEQLARLQVNARLMDELQASGSPTQFSPMCFYSILLPPPTPRQARTETWWLRTKARIVSRVVSVSSDPCGRSALRRGHAIGHGAAVHARAQALGKGLLRGVTT